MITYLNQGEIPTLTLEIAKPNRTVIGRIKDVLNRKQSVKLGRINEITFTVPFMITDENFNLIKNPTIDKVKSQYHIKATFDGQVEWYVVSNLNPTLNDDGKSYLNVQLKSLGYQLKNKKIRTWIGVFINGAYRKESLNAQQVLNDLLSNSSWSVSYIDSEFLTKYRSFDFSGTNTLDAIFTVAETFGAIIKWDTINKSISLIKQENAGINKGFRISERKYLKSLNKEEKSDELITRLYVFGKDGLSINNVNPTGNSYLEDFSFFMQGFKRDANKATLSSAEYMSDSLCHALLDYQAVIDSKKGQFSTFLSQKETLEAQKITKDTELLDLETQLKIVLNTIDLKQSNGTDVSAELTQKTNLETQIATKKTEISNVITQISDVDFQMGILKDLLDIENNLTSSQIIELDDYIIEETWEDQNYTDELELFNDGKKVFADLNKPKEIISINIINLFKLLEGNKDWEKFVIGDMFFIHSERLGVDVETQLIEMDIDHDSTDINVTIANTKDIERNDDKLAKLLYGSISTANTVNMGKYKWDQVNNVKTSVDDILQGKWNPSTNGINSGNQTVIIDDRGITSINKADPSKFIRITHGSMGFTNSFGNDYKLFLDASGVYAENLVGKMVISENLQIENQSGNYSINGDGFTIVSTDTKKRVILDVESGLKFQTKVNGIYKDKLYYDSVNDELVLDGEGNFKELKVQGKSVLTEDKTKINGNYIDNLVVGVNVTMGVNATITWGQVSNQPFIPSSAADVGALALDSPQMTYIDQSGVYTGTVVANQMYGGEITGVTINVNTDLRVGNNIYIGDYNSSEYKSLMFNLDAWMNTTPTGGLRINTTDKLEIPSSVEFTSYVNFTNTSYVDFAGAQVSGIYAKFK
jgi:hypothetical protein